MEGSSQLRAEDKYNQKHGHRWFASLDVIISFATTILLIICFVLSQPDFFTIVGLGLMIIGTALGSTRLLVICRFPLRANILRLIVSSCLAVIGSMMYIGINSDQHTWTNVGLAAITTEFAHLACCACTIWWALHLPEFDPNAVYGIDEAECDLSLAPADHRLHFDPTKLDDDEHRMDEIPDHSEDSHGGESEGPYGRLGNAIGNLTGGDHVEFPLRNLSDRERAECGRAAA
jgi:hypothetical protein